MAPLIRAPFAARDELIERLSAQGLSAPKWADPEQAAAARSAAAAPPPLTSAAAVSPTSAPAGPVPTTRGRQRVTLSPDQVADLLPVKARLSRWWIAKSFRTRVIGLVVASLMLTAVLLVAGLPLRTCAAAGAGLATFFVAVDETLAWLAREAKRYYRLGVVHLRFCVLIFAGAPTGFAVLLVLGK